MTDIPTRSVGSRPADPHSTPAPGEAPASATTGAVDAPARARRDTIKDILITTPAAREQLQSSIGLPPVKPPTPKLSREQTAGAESFAASLDGVVDGLLREAGGIGDLSADRLLAMFLLLNITDPNAAPSTHKKLHELATELRQLAIDASQAKSRNAQEALQEAYAFADQANALCFGLSVASVAVAVIGIILTIVVVVVGVIVSVCTAGGATPAAVGATAAVAGGTVAATGAVAGAATATSSGATVAVSAAVQAMAQAAVQAVTNLIAQLVSQAAAQAVQAVLQSVTQAVVQALTQAMVHLANQSAIEIALKLTIQVVVALTLAALQVTQAKVEHDVTQTTLDAEAQGNEAERFRKLAEMLQEQVEAEAAIIEIILKAKNDTVDAVRRMAEASFSTQLKLASV